MKAFFLSIAGDLALAAVILAMLLYIAAKALCPCGYSW